MANHDELMRTVGRLYDAATDAALWGEVLEEAADAIGAHGTHLLVFENGDVRLGIPGRYPQEANDEYVQDYSEHDIRLPRMFASPSHKLFTSESLVSQEEASRCVVHNEFLPKYEARYMIGARMSLSPKASIIFAGFRGPVAGAFASEEQKALEYLLPHIQRAVEIGQRLGNVRLLHAAGADAVERLPYGVIFVGDDGRVLFMNRVARSIGSERDGITVNESGVHALRPQDNADLQKLISQATTTSLGLARQTGGAISVNRPSGSRAYSVLVTPIIQSENIFASERPAAVVFVSDPEDDNETLDQVLTQLYGLTSAEAKLTSAVVQGHGLDWAAKRLGISMNTAHTHLKHVFEKTGAHRQAELVRMVLRGPAGLRLP